MAEFFNRYGAMLWDGTLETVYMAVISTVFAYVLGLPMGVLLFVTKKDGIAEAKHFNAVFGWLVNMLRSIPFIILVPSIFFLTRFIVGTIIGTNAAIVPLVVSAAPFVARMVEQSLEEIDPGVIEAARCMGATNLQIVFKVLLVESWPGIIRGMSIVAITIIGYGAMAGAVGAGGLGKIGYSYGFQRFNSTVMYTTVVLICLLVCIIQGIFNLIARKVDKRSIQRTRRRSKAAPTAVQYGAAAQTAAMQDALQWQAKGAKTRRE